MKTDNEENEIASEFLEKFQIASESAFNDKIDIRLLLKAVPSRIIDKKLQQVKKFNFLDLQSAFLFHQNSEDVQAFGYYDTLNKQRVNIIKNLIINQYNNLADCERITKTVKTKIQANEHTLTEFTEMYTQYQEQTELLKKMTKNKESPELA